MIMHSDSKPEICHICQTRFKYKKTLVRHMVQQHQVPREELNSLVQQRVLAQSRQANPNLSEMTQAEILSHFGGSSEQPLLLEETFQDDHDSF